MRLRFIHSFLFLAVVGAVTPRAARGEFISPLVNVQNEMLVMSNGKPARLHNNPAARDRSFAEVLAFITKDHTNRIAYRSERFMCTEYAVRFHDRAEAAGFRCALVSLSFSRGVGHALNAFRTSDRGLIYVDCTGSSAGDAADLYDTFGYIKKGKPYGRLHVRLGKRAPSNYRKYEDAAVIFRNLHAWDKEIASEQIALNAATKTLEARAEKAADEREANAVVAASAALQERVAKFNRKIAYRNDIATTFRLEYDENDAPVTRVDIFW
ncbi:MAG TPA: hypothetical protein VFT72_03375 [Opitutaceae bacterium]|nr:hypothetical protein [Opitutaceae bacterium]